MARLLFHKAEIFNTSNASQGTISGITVEGTSAALTPDTVMIENERELYDGYTGRFEIRTVNTTFDGGSNAILAAGTSNSTGADYIGVGGEEPLQGYIKLIGVGHTLVLDTTYLQGYNSFENGRLETVIVGQVADVDSTNAIGVEAGAAT